METLITQLENGQVFTVETVEPGLYQSVFPEHLADHSQLHSSVIDAWIYIATVITEILKDN
jgi:hypothetical protein